VLHGSLSQGIRDRIMEQFREGHINILVATDLAARGIDVKGFHMYHYHLTMCMAYNARRTARAGAKGFINGFTTGRSS
jgi:ATP-dependent RNA helicase DeaD